MFAAEQLTPFEVMVAVAVTLYCCVEAGLETTLSPVVISKPVAGDHV